MAIIRVYSAGANSLWWSACGVCRTHRDILQIFPVGRGDLHVWQWHKNEKGRLSRQQQTPLDLHLTFALLSLFLSLPLSISLFLSLSRASPPFTDSSAVICYSSLVVYLFQINPSVSALIARRWAVDYFIFATQGCRQIKLSPFFHLQTDGCYASTNTYFNGF